MEIFGKITRIDAPRTGVSKSTGNPWSSYPVEVTEVSGNWPNSIRIDIFGTEDELKQKGITLGAIGTMRFTCRVDQYGDRRYNNFGSAHWTPYKNENEAYIDLMKEEHDKAKAASEKPTADAVNASTAPAAPTQAQTDDKKKEGDNLPF